MPFSIDELNVLQPEKEKRSKNRAVPYSRYFGEMLLTNAEPNPVGESTGRGVRSSV